MIIPHKFIRIERVKYKIILSLILLLGFILRLYRFDNPIGDWHAFRQADTSAVSKVFVKEGLNLFTPTYFDISNIQSGMDNPNGYRFVEFPLYNAFQAGGFALFGVFTLEKWGRLITILASSFSTLFIFLLVKKYANAATGLFSAFFYAVLPFSVYYGRVILPDPSAAMAILGGVYFFDLWIEKKSRFTSKSTLVFILAVIFTASAFLLKPFTLFFTVPMLYIAWSAFGVGFIKKWFLWVFLILSILPLATWRMWITAYPEGIPASNWLFNEGNIRFTGAYFYWIFGDRFGRLILGYVGYIFLILGFLKRSEKHFGFFLSFMLASALYILIIARGNVQHDYYQILILPTICIFLSRGLATLFSLSQIFPKNNFYNTCAVVVLAGFTTISMVFLSWYHVRDYFNINNESLVIAGRIADKVLPTDARVIAANNGDTSFLYYINRKGWPAYQKSPEELSQMGATHIVIPNPTQQDLQGLGVQFPRFYSSSEVLILSL